MKKYIAITFLIGQVFYFTAWAQKLKKAGTPLKAFINLRSLAYILLFLCGKQASAQQPVRRDILLNFDWKFNLGDRPEAL